MCNQHYKQAIYRENREKILRQNKESKDRNREVIRASGRAYYQKNKPAYRANRVRYLKNNPHVVRKKSRQDRHRRRAHLAGADYDPTVTRPNLRRQYGDDCFYCGVTMSFRKAKRGALPDDLATLEHMTPLSRGGGHTWENCVLACWACNWGKNAKDDHEWEP